MTSGDRFSIKEFDLPNDLQELRIQRFAKIGPNIRVELAGL
jgi:hypothetical protein